MHVIKGDDLRDLYFKANLHFFDKNNYDYKKSNVTAHNFNVLMSCSTLAGEFDLADMGYSKRKWGILMKLYLDMEEWNLFIARLKNYASKSNKYIVDIALQLKERKNRSGSCLQTIALGYSEKTGWRMTVFSRASELTLRWYADLVFLKVLAKEVGKYLDIDPDSISLIWHASCTYQSITSMPLVLLMADKELGTTYQQDILEADLDSLTGWQWATKRRFDGSYHNGEYLSFKTQKRPVDAYRSMIGEIEPIPRVPYQSLSLPQVDLEKYDEAFFKKGGMR